MALKDKWKETGKNTGKAFANFGKALGTTAQVVFTDKKNEVDENGDSTLKKAWRDMGKGFGEAGKSFGHAAAGTVDKVLDSEVKEENKDIKKDEAIDVPVIEEKEEVK